MVGSRASSTRRASPSLRASASAQRSTSPGGSTPSSSLSWPELPPESNIVTTAFTCSHGLRLRPPSSAGKPVPPPKHPTLICRSCIRRALYRTSQRVPGPSRHRLRAMDTASHGRLDGVIADLQRIFGDRLEAVVAFGRVGAEGTHSLAL